jgi:hypothetical protein
MRGAPGFFAPKDHRCLQAPPRLFDAKYDRRFSSIFLPALGVFAKHVVHPERSGKNGVATQPFKPEEAPDEAPS